MVDIRAAVIVGPGFRLLVAVVIPDIPTVIKAASQLVLGYFRQSSTEIRTAGSCCMNAVN